jgi:short-subunit dehydrogenase
LYWTLIVTATLLLTTFCYDNSRAMKIVITGAAQGIGAAIAKQLANQSNSLILIDLQQDKLEQFAGELRAQCPDITLFAGDLTDATFFATVANYLQTNAIDVLVNNAAIAHKLAPFTELTEEQLELAYKINIKAPFQLIQAVLSGMQSRGSGQIIDFASRSNVYGYEGMGIYASTKAAITSFTGTIALENPMLKAITIIPGRTNTPMQASLRGETEASNAQGPDYVGSIVAQVINNQIPVNSGQHVLIDFGEYKVLTDLLKADLHNNMH